MKNLGLKIAVMMFCLPSLALAAGPRKAGASRANLVKGAQGAEIKTALIGADLNGVDADGLSKALDKGILESSDLNTLINNESGKLDSSLRENVIKLAAAEANYTKKEPFLQDRPKLDNARKKIIRLAIEVDQGSTHNQDSLSELAASMVDSYSSGREPAEAVTSIEATLKKTATEEAKAEAERTEKSLLELFPDCK